MKNKSLEIVITSLDALDDDDIVDVSAYPVLEPFTAAFPDGFFKNKSLTKVELVSVLQGVALAVYTNRTLPVRCRGCDCPIRHVCPLDKGGIAPVDSECALERISMVEWRQQYLHSLKIDPNDKVQSEMVDELVEIDIFNKYRFPAILSENITGFQEQVDTFSERTGTIIQSRKELSKAFDAKMAMARRREVILRELVATPMQIAKFKPGKKKDAASDMKELTNKAEAAYEVIEDDTKSSEKAG